MLQRFGKLFVAASMMLATIGPVSVQAENQMGYRLLSPQEAATLPRNGGVLGMNVSRSQQITDSGITFSVLRVDNVRRGSPAAQANFNAGDEVIAVNGRVFTTVASFAGYIASMAPGNNITVDYIPAGGGPAQAQRASVTIGAPGQTSSAGAEPRSGLSTGTKVAIGLGAAALFGCYKLGCFKRKGAVAAPQKGRFMPQGPAQPYRPAQQYQ